MWRCGRCSSEFCGGVRVFCGGGGVFGGGGGGGVFCGGGGGVCLVLVQGCLW